MGKQASKLKGYDNIFAQRLRALMERNNTTQEALAKGAGCTRQAVSQYMDGSSAPNIDKLMGIADYFRVSLDYLLGREKEQTDVEFINQICDYSGLSRMAVKELSFCKIRGKQYVALFNDLLLEANSLINSMHDFHIHLALENGEADKAFNALSALFNNYKEGLISPEDLCEKFEEWEEVYPLTHTKLSNGDLFKIQDIIISFTKKYYRSTIERSEEIRHQIFEIEGKIADVIVQDELEYNAYIDSLTPEEYDKYIQKAGEPNGDDQETE